MSFIVPLQRPPGHSTTYAISDQLTRIGETTQGGILEPLVKAGLYDIDEKHRSGETSAFGQTYYNLVGQASPSYDPYTGNIGRPSQHYAITSVVTGKSRADVTEDTPAILVPNIAPRPISDDTFLAPAMQEYDLRHTHPARRHEDFKFKRGQAHRSEMGNLRGIGEPDHQQLPGYNFAWRADGKNHLKEWRGWDHGHTITENFYNLDTSPISAMLIIGGIGIVALTLSNRF